MSGSGLKEGKTNTPNEIIINTKEAGYGGLSVSIEGKQKINFFKRCFIKKLYSGPSKADIQYKEGGTGDLKVLYTPSEPGFYILNIKFADHHVPGIKKFLFL